MELTKKLLGELQNRLKTGSRRGVHLNAIPANSLYKFDLYRLSHINKSLPNDFINSLLSEQPLKFKISWKENVLDINSLLKEEQAQIVNITKSFENLINQTETIESEKGINTFGFGFPLLVRRDQADNKLTVAPILIWSLRIKRTKEFNTWIINRNEDDPVYLNELLINHLQNDTKAEINQISPEIFNDGLVDKNELLDICMDLFSAINTTIPDNLRSLFDQELSHIKAIPEKKHYEKALVNSNNSLIDFCGLFSIFEVQKQNIINEYEDLLKNENTEIDLDNIEQQSFQSISSIETDPSQQSILNSIENTRNILIQGPPGTGKSQSLTAILINALENGKKTIVVCEKNTALEVLHNALRERGLNGNCALIKDIVKDRRAIVNSVRERIDDSSYKSQQYDYSKVPLENLTSKASRLISAINEKHKNVGRKIYNHHNWTDTIGLFLTNSKNLSEDSNLGLDNHKFTFDAKELSTITEILIKGQSLYEKYIINESKSFLNSKKFTGVNPFAIEQQIKDDFDKYEKEISGENSIIKRLMDEHAAEPDFMDFNASKGISFFISALFSKTKKKIRKDQNTISHLSKKLVHKIKTDDWVKKPIDSPDCPQIIDAIKDLIKIKQDYFNHETDLFTNEYNWFQFYNGLSDFNKSIVESIKTKGNWSKVFSTYYFNLLLLNNANKELPTNDDELKELTSSLSNVGKLQLKFIKEYWYSKQIKATKDFYQSNSDLSVENLYNKRSSQKYKRLSLRQIVKYDPALFTTFFPIVLTTPDVCSNLFKGMNKYFDIVLFDEASQLRLEDNLPALLKGKQIIVAGDEHQMPPSSYFSKIFDGTMDEEEDEEEEEIQIDRDNILLSCESLLDFAEELSFEKRYLDFHYRSKHPYLIDFSNYAFYNRRLKPLPNESDYIPIKYIQVNGTFSDHCNEIEAEAVLSIIENNIQRLPSGKYPTVGIATFNIAHRNLIKSKIIERQKFDHYADFNKKIIELEENGLFIKNLENIQGDERDVIILSTTYGVNKDGKFLHRFGPLNFKKGYKLLNVIITRAKYKVYVCSSIPEEVVLNYNEYLITEKSNNKRAVFFAYLAYSKAVSENNEELRLSVLNSLTVNSNKSITIEHPDAELESPFEEEVFNILSDHFESRKIIPQFKFAEFRIDIVYEPQIDGLPKIAIECDGASYHSSNEAYLYDYHRQKILESHGFIFYRIWSTNWWRNPKREAKQLIDFIKKIEKQVPKAVKTNDEIAQAFIHDFLTTTKSSLQKEKKSRVNSRTLPNLQNNKARSDQKSLNNKTWESESFLWSSSPIEGYAYAPYMKAWYKKKELTPTNRQTTLTENEIPDNVRKAETGNIVQIKYMNTGNIFNIHLVDYELTKHEVIDGIQKVNIKSPLAVSIHGKAVGEIVKVGNLDNFVEIMEIKN